MNCEENTPMEKPNSVALDALLVEAESRVNGRQLSPKAQKVLDRLRADIERLKNPKPAKGPLVVCYPHAEFRWPSDFGPIEILRSFERSDGQPLL